MTDKTEAPELKPCPFCKSVNVSAEGWMRNDGKTGPACDDCGGSADTVDLWNAAPRTDACAEVKPLVWGGKAGSGDYHAKCSLTGRWMVLHMPNDVFIADGPDGRTISEHDNETDALRACEENRLTRILPVITARPTSEVHAEGYDAGKAAGRAEALEKAAKRADQRAESWRFIGRGGIAEDYEDYASKLRALAGEQGE